MAPHACIDLVSNGRVATDIRPGPTRLLHSLRAVRRYADRPIPDAIVLDILEIARWTGSSKNSEPWELVVVEDRTTLAALAELAPNGEHLRQAALAIVQIVPSTQRVFDAGRQAERLMLAAWAHGVGSCPASLFNRDNPQRGKALLGIPPTRRVTTIIGFGYPEDRTRRAVPADRHGRLRTGRRPLADLVSWGRYGQRERSAP
jgi:nitroreductase